MNLNDVLRSFGINEAPVISEINSGHINATYHVVAGDRGEYILQSLNTGIFTRPEAVMANISILEKLFSSPEERVRVPHFLAAEDGLNYVSTEDGFYRLYEYISPSEKSDYFSAGAAFGAFIKGLSRKNVRFEETIADFHNYSLYFSALTAADKISSLKKIDSMVMGRLSSLQSTLEQVFTVDFPVRSVHNDAKISNVITGEKCTIIDLDTVMKGYAAIDYGDMIRSVCSPESLDFTVIRDITRGFADGLEGTLTEDEIYSLYYGILYVTGELVVRYLIDYLSADKYFKGKTSAECLSRANELLNQLNRFINSGEELTTIIYEEFR